MDLSAGVWTKGLNMATAVTILLSHLQVLHYAKRFPNKKPRIFNTVLQPHNHLFRDWAEHTLSFLSRVKDCVLEEEYHSLAQPFTSIAPFLFKEHIRFRIRNSALAPPRVQLIFRGQFLHLDTTKLAQSS